MGTQLLARTIGGVRHAREIALEIIEIENQRWRGDLMLPLGRPDILGLFFRLQ
jgi:hypothetical protein